MALIDTHTHLDSFARRGDLPAVLERARSAGVEAMITIGTDTDDWGLYRDLAAAHPGRVYYTAGLHPCSVGEDWENRLGYLDGDFGVGPDLRAGRTTRDGPPGGRALPVALGECGLDRFHLPKDDPAAAERIFGWQQAAFAAQLALAKRLGCPVVVHSRGAFQECVAMIDAGGVDWSRVVFHCFTEGAAEMAELVRRGGWGSFTGIVTYKSADNVRQAAKAQGLERLMIETDAPYLTPMPHRGKPNEPAFVRHTAEYLAREVFGVDYEQLAQISTATARSFFGLDR
ncbi:MAG: TatD family hydrolase [Opitutaceae bacterium]|nr:TatD family hydrolase [Opitutaceae bacterium]